MNIKVLIKDGMSVVSIDSLSFNSNPFILGKYLPYESIHNEYKEFRLELSYEYTYCYKELYENDNLLHNYFLDILKKFVEKYIYKYTCSFVHSHIQGKLFFGISDSGEIIGVPMKRDDKVFFEDIIRQELDTFIEDYSVNIDFIEINIDSFSNFFYYTSKEFLKRKEEELDKYLEYIIDFETKKKEYITRLESYRKSINRVLNDVNIRSEFEGFLKENDVYEVFKEELKGKYNFNFSNEDIKEYKNKNYNIVYWMAIFRDLKSTETIRDLKPKWDYTYKLIDPHFQLLQEFKPILPDLIDRGYGMYVIKITFPIDVNNKASIKYKDDNHTHLYRGLSPMGDPCCHCFC